MDKGVTVTAHLTLNGAYKHHPAAKRALDILEQAGVKFVPLVGGDKLRTALASYGANQIPDELKT